MATEIEENNSPTEGPNDSEQICVYCGEEKPTGIDSRCPDGVMCVYPNIHCALCGEGKGGCECDPCLYGEHDWIVEGHSNGCGGTWDEVECRYCDSEISDDEWEDLTAPDEDAAYVAYKEDF